MGQDLFLWSHWFCTLKHLHQQNVLIIIIFSLWLPLVNPGEGGGGGGVSRSVGS